MSHNDKYSEGADFHLSTILGTFDLFVPEAKDVAAMDVGGTSDPFYKVLHMSGIEQGNHSWTSKVHKSTLNPKWNARWHSWVYGLPVKFRIEAYDHDLIGSNDFLGQVEIEFNTPQDVLEDKWYDLQKRPGKSDSKVKGQIRVVSAMKLLQNFRWTPADLFPSLTHIMVDINQLHGRLEIQGEIENDLQLLQSLAALNIPIPEKTYHKKSGKALAFTIYMKPLFNIMSWVKAKKVGDMQQDVFMKILNALSVLGFTLLRGDQLHRGVKGRTQFERGLYLVKTKGSGTPTDQFVLLEYAIDIATKKLQVELQGYVPDDLLQAMKGMFDFEETKRGDGSHCSWHFVVPGGEGAVSWTTDAVKRKENVLQNFMLRVMNQLTQLGFVYVTCYGAGHILVRETGAASGALAPRGNYMLCDPWVIFGDKAIQLQGQDVTEQLAQGICDQMFPGEGRKVKPYVNKKTKENLLWSLPLPSLSTGPTFSSEEVRRRENIVQNTLMQAITKLSAQGFQLMGPADQDGLIIQRIINSPGTRYILIDPCYQMGTCLELQGIEDEQIIGKVAADLGIEKIRKTTNPSRDKELLSYILPIPGMGMNPFTGTHEFRLRNNRLQSYLMKALTSLGQFGFEPLTQYGDDSILLRYNPNFKPGRLILLDGGLASNKLAIELQGDFDQQLLNDLAERTGLQQPEPMLHGSDNYLVAWRMRTGMNMWLATHQGGNISRNHRRKYNLYQNLWLVMLSHLIHHGWRHMFPWKRFDSVSHVLYRPN